MIANILILSFVTLQRLAELQLSSHNTHKLLAQGAREHSPAHYPLIVAVHLLWLSSLWLLALSRQVHVFWLVIFALIELGRIWVIASLGSRWTTRIIILPGARLVSRGPYRWVRHPNYWIVAAEIAVLPLIFGLWQVALIFTFLNASVLTIRIRQENRALGLDQRG